MSAIIPYFLAPDYDPNARVVKPFTLIHGVRFVLLNAHGKIIMVRVHQRQFNAPMSHNFSKADMALLRKPNNRLIISIACTGASQEFAIYYMVEHEQSHSLPPKTLLELTTKDAWYNRRYKFSWVSVRMAMSLLEEKMKLGEETGAGGWDDMHRFFASALRTYQDLMEHENRKEHARVLAELGSLGLGEEKKESGRGNAGGGSCSVM